MPKVQVTSKIELDFDEVLQGVARLETIELEQFAEKIIALRAQRRAPSLPQNEAELLEKINQGMSPDIRSRYAELNIKLHEETITPEEQQELLNLTDQRELADAERIRNLITLAELRNVSVDDLIIQLGIRRPTYA
ncbi:MAG: STAS/SEC14 domain-containing protein [Chloroflexi bacterium]|nr:STAS/SEC14 domain-containing protein [Chloroflexota bacterium]